MALNLKALRKALFRERRAIEVREQLRAHLDSGKKLNAEGYWLLLATYEPKGKPPSELTKVVDGLLASFDTPAGKKLLAHRDRLKLLRVVGEHLLNARRWRDAFDTHVRYYELEPSLAADMHADLLRSAMKLDDAALARAWSIHEKLAKKNRGWVDFPKLKRVVKRAEEKMASIDVESSEPDDELGALIASIREAGGARSWDGERFDRPKPMHEDAIRALRLGRRKPPESLARWLAFDASWLPLFDGDALAIVTLEAFFSDYAERMGMQRKAGKDFARAQRHALKPSTKVIVLPPSASQEKLFVVDRVDERGEMPVFAVEKEEAFPAYDDFGEFVVAYLSACSPKKTRRRK